MDNIMDIWERLYEKAKEQYHPEDVSPLYMLIMLCVRLKQITARFIQVSVLRAAAE